MVLKTGRRLNDDAKTINIFFIFKIIQLVFDDWNVGGPCHKWAYTKCEQFGETEI